MKKKSVPYSLIVYTNMLRVVKNVTWRQRITNEVLCAGSWPHLETGALVQRSLKEE